MSDPVPAPQRARWFVLGLLSAIYMMNVADRLVLSILAQGIKSDLHLSDFEVGLLIGPAIAFFYAMLGVPMAYVADRVRRVRFLALCLSGWSIMTGLGGLAANGLQLAASRIGVSAVEAGGSPASSSILADYFQPRERPTAMGVYSSASTLGVLIGFGFGGWINVYCGWRWTLFVAGVPGIVLALLLITTVREPERGACDPGRRSQAVQFSPHSVLATFRALWDSRFYRNIVLLAGIANFPFQVIINWAPSLVIRKFAAGSGSTGLSLGIGIALCGGVVQVIAGVVTSRLVSRGLARPILIAAILELCSAPVLLGATFASTLPLCVVLICIAYGLQAFFIPIYWSVSQNHVPADTRAMAGAIMLFAIAVVGHGCAAPLIGELSDLLAPRYGSASLQYAFAIATSVNLVVAVLFWRTAVEAKKNGA